MMEEAEERGLSIGFTEREEEPEKDCSRVRVASMKAVPPREDRLVLEVIGEVGVDSATFLDTDGVATLTLVAAQPAFRTAPLGASGPPRRRSAVRHYTAGSSCGAGSACARWPGVIPRSLLNRLKGSA